MSIALPKETSQQGVASIRRYFEERLDAQAYFQEKTTDLDGSCYQPELTYWKRR